MGHGEIGDIEVRHAGHAGLVGQGGQVGDELGVAVVAQSLGADHLIAGAGQRQRYPVLEAAGGVAANRFGLVGMRFGKKGTGHEEQGGGKHETPDKHANGLR